MQMMKIRSRRKSGDLRIAVIESHGAALLALKDPAGGLFGSFDVAFSPDGTRLVSWGTEVIIS